MQIIFKAAAVQILLLLIIMFLVSGSSAAVELKELTAEEVKQIKLYENPSTGHRWEVEVEKPEVLSVIENSCQPLEKSSDFVGQGGIHNWSLKGEKKGFTLVKFNLISPGAEKAVSQKKYLFAVDLMSEQLTVDEILEIELAENPSTGYRWQLYLPENKTLQLLQEEYKSSAESSETKDDDQAQSEKEGSQIRVGQGGIKSWTFRGLEAGYQLLTFKLARSGGEAIKTVEYLILVD